MCISDILKDPRCDIPLSDQKRLISLASSLDQLGYFPRDVVDIIAGNNHFNLFVPKERGGLNYSLIQGMKVVEAYARIEGNLGWIVQIGAGGGVFSAYLSEEVSARFFGRQHQVVAGSDFVGGQATPWKDGYKVSGEWKYASGSLHATAFTGNCQIASGPEKGRIKAIIVPADQVQVTEDWNAMGMRATDSHSFRIHEVFVPDNQTFVLNQEHLFIKNRLLKIPFLIFARALFTPVLLGVTNQYLILFQEYLRVRNHHENSQGWLDVRNLEQCWKICRKRLYEFTKDICKSTESLPISTNQESAFARVCVQITGDLLRSIDECHRHTGMEGVNMDKPINVVYRNIKTATAHILLRPFSLLS